MTKITVKVIHVYSYFAKKIIKNLFENDEVKIWNGIMYQKIIM